MLGRLRQKKKTNVGTKSVPVWNTFVKTLTEQFSKLFVNLFSSLSSFLLFFVSLNKVTQIVLSITNANEGAAFVCMSNLLLNYLPAHHEFIYRPLIINTYYLQFSMYSTAIKQFFFRYFLIEDSLNQSSQLDLQGKAYIHPVVTTHHCYSGIRNTITRWNSEVKMKGVEQSDLTVVLFVEKKYRRVPCEMESQRRHIAATTYLRSSKLLKKMPARNVFTLFHYCRLMGTCGLL